jgi:Holliday junction resolvase RusA-like endonuclease
MALKEFTFTVPGAPPSVNHMYEQVRRLSATGQSFGVKKGDAVAEYQTFAGMCVRLSKPKGWLDSWTEGTYIRVTYAFTLKRHADCDNLMKALNDAIAGALGVDDKWFLPSVLCKHVDSKSEPSVVVAISAAEGCSHGL